MGHVPHEELPEIFNKYEGFIYKGLWPDTGPATVIEAMLCGCEIYTDPALATILTNNFKNDDDLRQRIKEAKPGFWKKLEEISSKEQVKFFISVEMNAGQMLEDVKLSVCGRKPVHFFGRLGGIIPTPEEVLQAVKSYTGETS